MTQNSTNLPDDEQARAFCVMLSAGLPAETAILYFTDSDDPAQITFLVKKWLRSRAVQKAQKDLSGKSWQDMSMEERIEAGLNQQYNNLAYLCYSTNYITASDKEKAKLDTARTALEAKKAGTSGTLDPMSRFFEDVKSGRIQLNKPVPRLN